ncbi:MAG: transposase [Phycisphaerae bacterium]|nr:transposase [Phycisphaerae bacterium]
MARPLRIVIPDGIYHVTTRGLERRKIVRDDQDRRRYVSLVGRVARQRDWRVLSWALMDNHSHLFVRTPHGDLSAGMHDLNSGYASTFNQRHERVGPLFQGRFKSVLVEKDYHYWELSRYIHLNPVRAGIVTRPDAYPWGSCREYLGVRDVPEWLATEEVLSQHGNTIGSARRAYARFLEEALDNPPVSPLREAVAGTVLGSPSFVERVKSMIEPDRADPNLPAARRLFADISCDHVAQAVAAELRVDSKSLRARGRHGNDARLVGVYLCRTVARMLAKQVGLYFGDVGGSAVSNMVAKASRRRKVDKKFDSLLRAIEARL